MEREIKIVSGDGEIRYWWVSLLAGILSVAVGIWCIATPAESLMALTTVFICVLIATGICNAVFAAVNARESIGWGWTLARGILELLLGIWLIALPLSFVAEMLVLIVGFWILFYAVLGIGEACELQRLGVRGWGWLLACGILCLILSFIYLVTPVYGGFFVVLYAGLSFLFYGIFRIVLAFTLHRLGRE